MTLYNENGNYPASAIEDGSIFEGEMKWSEWEAKYKPQVNHLTKYPSSDRDYMFETYGEEYEYVKSIDPNRVWTWVEGDMSSIIIAGRAFVNRMGYYVTEVPWEDENEMVLLSVEVECECYKEQGYGPFTFPSGDEYWENGDPNCPECEGYGLRTAYVD